MRVTRKSGLFELINKLTTSEKRYIKQQINKSGEEKSNYAMLFNVIVKTENCDDEKLKKKLGKTAIIKQWSRNKNYLYNYTLRTLQAYHQQDAKFEVHNNLQQVDILYSKGLEGDAYQLLKKTKRLALEGIYPTLLPFIAEWEMRLGRLIWNYEEEKEILDYQENNDWAIALADNLLSIEMYRTDVLKNMIIKGRHIRMEGKNQEILNKPIFKSIDEAKSPFGKWALCTTKNILYAQIWQYLKAYTVAKEDLEVHRKFPLLKKHAPRTYITSINNFLAIGIEVQQWEEVESVLKEVENYVSTSNNKINNLLLQSIRYLTILQLNIRKCNFKKGLEYGAEIEAFIEQNKNESHTYIRPDYLLHAYTVICIVNEKYEKALELIEEIEKIQKIAIYKNVALLMKAVCLYENNELLQLPYVIRSIYRTLLNKNDLFELERIILNLLKASVKVASKEEVKKIFRKYLIQLNRLVAVASKAELELLSYFNFIAWIESNVTDRPFLDVLIAYKEQNILVYSVR